MRRSERVENGEREGDMARVKKRQNDNARPSYMNMQVLAGARIKQTT